MSPLRVHAKNVFHNTWRVAAIWDPSLSIIPSTFGSPFEKRILGLLNREPKQRQCITQTPYSPVRLSPAAISVETISGQGRHNDARMQLGVWVGAHFRRLRSLLCAHYGADAEGIEIPVHSLAIVDVNVFAIMYAMEQDEQTWILPGSQFDVPTTVMEGYKCLAALRCLGEWANRDFRSWMENVLLPPTA